MNPPCHQCALGLLCSLHSSPPASSSSSPPPLNANFAEGASGQSTLTKSTPFVHYDPSYSPIPTAGLSRDGAYPLPEKHWHSPANGPAPQSTRKRILEASDTPHNHASSSKRQRGPNGSASRTTDLELPPTIMATVPTSQLNEPRQLRSAACECWYNLAECDTAEPPIGVPLAELVASDALYQASMPFCKFKRHKSAYFRCIPCLRDNGKWKVWDGSSGGGTTRFRDHLDGHHTTEFREKCKIEGVVFPTQGTKAANDEGKEEIEFSYELLNTCLAQWVAVSDQSMSSVELPEFRQLLLVCSRAPRLSDADIPHRTKLTTITEELYKEEMARIRKGLKAALGHVCVTTDLWSDDTLRSFMAVTVHYMNCERNLAEHLLAFRCIKGRHTGENLGKYIYGIFQDAGILQKLGHITLDNAGNNGTMMAELEKTFAEVGQRYDRKTNRIRCFPHVINLAVQAILEALPLAARKIREQVAALGEVPNDELTSYLEALEALPVHICRESVKSMRSTGFRCEGLRNTIIDGNLKKLFKTATGQVLILPILQLILDCPTRWSSTYNMIVRYLELYPAIALYAQQNPSTTIPLANHKQFEVLQDISHVLSLLHHAQQLLSAELTPTLALALPVYEALIHALKDAQMMVPELSPAIECGIKKLESYLEKARDQPAYALAMAVNPCLKLNWMAEHWCQRQRNEAKVAVKNAMLKVRREQFKRSPTAFSDVAPPTSRGDRAAQAQQHGYKSLLTAAANFRRASNPISQNVASETPSAPSQPPSERELLIAHMNDVDNEIERWENFEWQGDKTMGTINLVEFWKIHRYMFPLLYRVAMNILPVQASSVSSERAFSSSKMTCTRERNRISAEHMEYLQVLKHSLHRRRATPDNKQTLDFMTHIVGEESDDECE